MKNILKVLGVVTGVVLVAKVFYNIGYNVAVEENVDYLDETDDDFFENFEDPCEGVHTDMEICMACSNRNNCSWKSFNADDIIVDNRTEDILKDTKGTISI